MMTLNILSSNCRIFSPVKPGRERKALEEDSILQCTGCRDKFTMINRKHHCDKCGNLFCGNCSTNYSKENTANNVTKERICISCSTKAFLLRRKMKATKKISKSIVIKSAKFAKLEAWDSPERKASTPIKPTMNAAPASVPQLLEAPTPPREIVQPCVLSPEGDESDLLIKKSGYTPERSSDDAEDEDEEGTRRMNQGMLCILPPTVFSFIFGSEST